ncbi:DUF2147 domain-containing protein [Enterovirga aerilata]|uniref:DUF2147 domain-containing protein n=1 Tax=Enterovirga aerilata TaxID=2730920 RepID=A0A849I6J5_9HYPH|nr:DUF2147 domain-containing protein [Enterovirga sp. DB1703]NNM73324.1 DUF2147 domain-containing protein [Enterovirga sp. DB1703]
MAGAAASLLIAGAASAESGRITGVWLTENGDSKIRISPCGKGYCGTVVWAKTQGVDENNPDPSLRKRPIVGMPLTRDMRPAGDRYAGSIYNPDNGKTYSVTMQVRGTSKLEVEGCVLGFLCGGESWSRLPDETASAEPVPKAR